MKNPLACYARRSFTTNSLNLKQSFVPNHNETQEEDINRLEEFLKPLERLFVLTGAGISTESGIPDYRGEGVGLYATSTKRPIQHKVFMDSAKARQSYWARNFVGWPRWSDTRPNSAHLVLAAWEREHRVRRLVTQNVDQLHYKAGSMGVVELHGTNSLVTCMSCNYSTPRVSFQRQLAEHNPDMVPWESQHIRPDGDVELTEEEVANFQVPRCPKCKTGILKPYVVFFGDNVPRERVEGVKKDVSNSDGVLVVGSSLFVFSGFRFITQAKEEGIPIAILNIGKTRADHLANLKIDAKAGDVLTKLNL